MSARCAGIRLLVVGVVAVLLALLPSGQTRARVFNPDLRWDGSELAGAYLLNPVQLLDSTESSLTLEAKSLGDDSGWRASLVRLEETGLVGGLIAAWPDETYVYGAAGRIGAHLGAGFGIERQVQDDGAPVYSALVGALAKAWPASLRVAGSFPLDESEGETMGEAVAALTSRIIGVRVGYLLGDLPSQGWASLEVGGKAIRVAYARDFDEAGWRESESISLRMGTVRYLTLTQQREDGCDEYWLGVGARF